MNEGAKRIYDSELPSLELPQDDGTKYSPFSRESSFGERIPTMVNPKISPQGAHMPSENEDFIAIPFRKYTPEGLAKSFNRAILSRRDLDLTKKDSRRGAEMLNKYFDYSRRAKEMNDKILENQTIIHTLKKTIKIISSELEVRGKECQDLYNQLISVSDKNTIEYQESCKEYNKKRDEFGNLSIQLPNLTTDLKAMQEESERTFKDFMRLQYNADVFKEVLERGVINDKNALKEEITYRDPSLDPEMKEMLINNAIEMAFRAINFGELPPEETPCKPYIDENGKEHFISFFHGCEPSNEEIAAYEYYLREDGGLDLPRMVSDIKNGQYKIVIQKDAPDDRIQSEDMLVPIVIEEDPDEEIDRYFEEGEKYWRKT